jgi:bifunctional UDP-N-acetylglucosamine pyrophosphorylase / glucosamine-1-phosphate N-acetyltransferase
MSIGAVVMAAGQGTRMKSALPKVLHEIAGRPLVGWVLDALAGVRVTHTVVVVGHGAEAVKAVLPAQTKVALQREQHGTGHATQIGLRALDRSCDTVIVLSGDTPLLERDLLKRLVRAHTRSGRAATLVSAILDDAAGYGRVVRDGAHVRIVEARDASAAELAIQEINAGLYIFDRAKLERALRKVGRDNAQGEVYLPDALPLLGGDIGVLISPDPDVVLGVNSRVELAECGAIIQDRLRERLLIAGVAMPDPQAVYLDADVVVGADAVLHPGTHLQGATSIGAGCVIGPNVVANNCVVGEGTTALFAHMTDSVIGAGCQIGPFAYLRPGVTVEDGGKIGTYVEVKNSRVGKKAKVPHLSYIGDADIGAGTNIGAGNITANYDGFRKHRTTIGSGVKTGSDCVFVAPVSIGDRAMTAAGSILTHDVPAGALGIARARQENLEGFTERAEAKARAAMKRDGKRSR